MMSLDKSDNQDEFSFDGDNRSSFNHVNDDSAASLEESLKNKESSQEADISNDSQESENKAEIEAEHTEEEHLEEVFLNEGANESLGGMYAHYFLDYASYVILERAVPYLSDGLKPVQRRILHAMRELEDGRYNKVAKIIGNTMAYHPHGDASIADAMVQVGQKDLLIDMQGNWGNVLTGDRAAASRYIEARLTPFALEVLYSPKITEWMSSYDGRSKEPVSLPVKFPLLLAQGGEGIAVGLACKILPHNFLELIDASIAALRNQKFELLPDFLTGGLMDASDYKEGLRGGKVRLRAEMSIIKVNRSQVINITEIPATTTTSSLIDSIVSAAEKNKIKISKIEDNTSAEANILVYLPAGSDAELAMEGLYAFTDCEVSISSNVCVISEGKPQFIGVNEVLRQSAFHTKQMLGQELEVKLDELKNRWHALSLEKIFIEQKIYRDIESCETWEEVLAAIIKGLKPFIKELEKPVSKDDIIKLTEIKIKKISKYDQDKAQNQLDLLTQDIEQIQKDINQLTKYAIRYFKNLAKSYGKGKERKTKITSFAKINRSQVAIATETLRLDKKEGFAGWGLKRTEGEELCKCSKLDDILVIDKDGVLTVRKVTEKFYVGKSPLYVGVLNKEKPLIFTLVYRNGRAGDVMIKRFKVGGVTRDREYPLTQGKAGSRVLYFNYHETEESSNQGGVMLHLKSDLALKNLSRLVLFENYRIKTRSSKGNLLTKHPVDRVVNALKKDLEESN